MYDGPGTDSHEPTAIRFLLARERYDALLAVGDPARAPTVAATGKSAAT